MKPARKAVNVIRVDLAARMLLTMRRAKDHTVPIDRQAQSIHNLPQGEGIAILCEIKCQIKRHCESRFSGSEGEKGKDCGGTRFLGEQEDPGNPFLCNPAFCAGPGPFPKNSKCLAWITESCRYSGTGYIQSSRSRLMLAPRRVDPHPLRQKTLRWLAFDHRIVVMAIHCGFR